MIDIVNSTGNAIKLAEGNNLLASYWKALSAYSEFRVLLGSDEIEALTTTKTGNKITGALVRYKGVTGALVLLPYIDFELDDYYEKKGKELYWTDKALDLGNRFTSSIISLDKAILARSSRTPTPDWVVRDEFILPKEANIRTNLLTISTKLEKLQKEREKYNAELSDAIVLKNLLYETGKPLELAVRQALDLIGFKTSKFHDNESEFDVVFESKEGRMIGEVEGKDNKPINVNKMRQLEMNIQEDFSKIEASDFAKGVLIGNAFRLDDPETRKDFFTQKCIMAANRNKVALIKTPDLFAIAQYLSGESDENFAADCRKAIASSIGEVTFPSIPLKDASPSNLGN